MINGYIPSITLVTAFRKRSWHNLGTSALELRALYKHLVINGASLL